MANARISPGRESCRIMLERNYGTDCPLETDEDYCEFARWLQEDNPALFTIMLCCYANSIPGVMRNTEGEHVKDVVKKGK